MGAVNQFSQQQQTVCKPPSKANNCKSMGKTTRSHSIPEWRNTAWVTISLVCAKADSGSNQTVK